MTLSQPSVPHPAKALMLGLSLAFGLVACGGGGSTASLPLSSPSAPGATASPASTCATSVSRYSTTVALGGTATSVAFPSVGCYSGEVLFPASTQSGTLTLTVSTTAQVTQASSRRLLHSQVNNPLLYFTVTASGAAQLVSQPGFDIVGAAASNAVYWIAVFDPTNTTSNVVLIGPGVPDGNMTVFQVNSIGPSFTTGETYQFVLFSLPGTPPSPEPSSTASPHVQEFSMPGAEEIAKGPDGNLWVTACTLLANNTCNSSTIAKVTISGTSQIFQTGQSFQYTPGVSWAADGTLWVAQNGNLVDVATSGSVTPNFASPLPVLTRNPFFMGLAAQNNYIWAAGTGCGIACPNANWLEQFDTNTKAAVAVFPTNANSGASLQAIPANITSKSDGTIWFTEASCNLAAADGCYGISTPGWIGEIATDGSLHEYHAPAGVQPFGITAGADGTIWFTEATGNNVGHVASDGTITEVPFIVNSYATGITTASDGTLWVASHAGLSQLSGNGTRMATYPTLAGWPYKLIQGPDGDIWYTANVQTFIASQTTAPFQYFLTTAANAYEPNFVQTIGVLSYPGRTTQSRLRSATR
jgi:virginiamycin B lyase